MYFKNCLVRLISPEGKGQWVWCDGQVPKKGYQFRTANEVSSAFYVNKVEFKKWKIETRFPVGFFNTKQSVVFGDRVGKRQNSKGLYFQQNYFLTTMEHLVSEAGLTRGASEHVNLGLVYSGKIKICPELANFVFEQQKYVSLQEAFAQLRGKRVFARALSKDFAIVPHHELKSDYLIFLGHNPVAELLSRTKVRVVVPEFLQELANFFIPQGAEILQAK